MLLYNLVCNKKSTTNFLLYESRNAFSHICSVRFELATTLKRFRWKHFEALLFEFGFATHSVPFKYFTFDFDIDGSLLSPDRLRKIRKKKI